MFDELQRLQDNSPLYRLLSQYAQVDAAGHTTWQGRLMELEGADASDLVKLHAELIICDWIELNIGSAAVKETRKVGGCYRATPAGVRALKLVQAGTVSQTSDEEIPVTADRKSGDEEVPAKRKRKSRQAEDPRRAAGEKVMGISEPPSAAAPDELAGAAPAAA